MTKLLITIIKTNLLYCVIVIHSFITISIQVPIYIQNWNYALPVSLSASNHCHMLICVVGVLFRNETEQEQSSNIV